MSYVRPVDLPVSSGYGYRGDGFHAGIDFSDGVPGHPIHAVEAGIVVYREFEPGGFGNTVTILHDDGMKSGYGHMIGPAIVNYGDRVSAGQVIGYVGNTGYSFGAHLHLWMGSSPNLPGAIDPSPYVLGAPAPSTGGDLTMADIDTIGQWLKDVEGRLKDTLGTWMQEQSKNVVAVLDKRIDDLQAYIDQRLASLPASQGGGLNEEQIRAVVREEIDRTKLGT